jgi:hypothetical protein
MSDISVKLKSADEIHNHIEVITIYETGSWASPRGGWLDGTKGKWTQKPEGVILFVDADVNTTAGRLLGLNQPFPQVGTTGKFDLSKPVVTVGMWTLA